MTWTKKTFTSRSQLVTKSFCFIIVVWPNGLQRFLSDLFSRGARTNRKHNPIINFQLKAARAGPRALTSGKTRLGFPSHLGSCPVRGLSLRRCSRDGHHRNLASRSWKTPPAIPAQRPANSIQSGVESKLARRSNKDRIRDRPNGK